ncbi:MAG: anaerobic ribonucleoside-triphosphate reductase [Candidatus Verstraetearchaeota archaeon]|nr:anaerobic ribonucleoside-triphosphate reductase [Candidatus Verstraetearchaeota archaeon]
MTEAVLNGKLPPPVRRSDGVIIPFDKELIVKSLLKETQLVKTLYGGTPMKEEDARRIADEVEEDIRSMKLRFLSGPLIRELVSVKLLEHGFDKQRNVYTRVGMPLYDVYSIDNSEGYEAKENANLQPNPETFHKKKADFLSKESYLLMLPSNVADAHLRGDIHIHDLEYWGVRPFCQDWDLRYFFYYGLMPDGTGTHTSVAGPAKHAEVAMLHAAKVLGAAQTNFAGGQGFFNFTVFMAPYLMEMDDRKIHQLAQMFLYEMTQLYVARGGQPVFSSIQIESGVPKVWQEAPVVSHGKVWKDMRYGDLEGKVHAFANALLDEYMKGDAVGKMFNFPKPEVVQRTRYWNDKSFEDIMIKAAQLSAKFGSTYYDNMIPAYRGGEDGVSCFQCCAYAFAEDGRSESFRRKILFEDGAHFSMGGMQVVTLNMPRLAYKSGGDEARLPEVLRETMSVAKEAHLLKHRLMKHQFERGLVPFASQRPRGAPPAVDIDNLSHTIGFAGMNEMVEHMTGYQLHEDQSAQRLALKTLIEMDRVRKEYSTETGMKFSIARTPAESSAQRFAVADMIHYTKFARELVKGDLEAALPGYRESRDVPIYYTNGAHVNVAAQVPLYERLAIEQRFFPILKGGDIFHVWLGEVNPDPDALLKLNRRLANESWIGYWSHTKDITMCMSCGYVGGGLNARCPVCGSESLKHYSRITGYYQDVSSWNAAKRQELRDRYRVRISA